MASTVIPHGEVWKARRRGGCFFDHGGVRRAAPLRGVRQATQLEHADRASGGRCRRYRRDPWSLAHSHCNRHARLSVTKTVYDVQTDPIPATCKPRRSYQRHKTSNPGGSRRWGWFCDFDRYPSLFGVVVLWGWCRHQFGLTSILRRRHSRPTPIGYERAIVHGRRSLRRAGRTCLGVGFGPPPTGRLSGLLSDHFAGQVFRCAPS